MKSEIRYLSRAIKCLPLLRTRNVRDIEDFYLAAFEAYSDAGYYVEEPERHKDSEFQCVLNVLRAGLGDEHYKEDEFYNIFV